MSAETTKKDALLEQIWWATAKDILRKLKDGTASASDVANAMKLLKDNGITLDSRPLKEGEYEGSPLPEILKQLPEFPDEAQ